MQAERARELLPEDLPDSPPGPKLPATEPGVGRDGELMRRTALGDRDACPSGDLVLQRAMGLDRRGVEAASQRWRPWRAYAVSHLWAQAAYAG